MKWEFTNGGKPFLMPQQGYQPTITEPPNHTQIKVHSISPYTAKKSLGVWKSMDQSNEAHLQALQEKHKHFHESFISHKTTPHGALHLYKTVYFTQIGFSLPSTSLQTHEVKSLKSSIISTLLRKLNLPKTFPSALVFWSHSILALEVPDLEFS